MSTFRKVYRELNDAEKEHIEQIKDAAQALELLINGTHRLNGVTPNAVRCVKLAMTNLEQAVMWATKAFT
jgi:hypothetical protein